LHNWGRGGGRFPGLKPYGAFFKAIAAKAPELGRLDKYLIDDSALDVPKVAAEVWSLIESLEIVTNDSKIVSGTKAMHHLLPDLVVPMDHGVHATFFRTTKCCVRLVAPSPEAHATLTTWRCATPYPGVPGIPPASPTRTAAAEERSKELRRIAVSRSCVLRDAPPVLAWGRLSGRSSEAVNELENDGLHEHPASFETAPCASSG
jgi:hypothetical protein